MTRLIDADALIANQFKNDISYKAFVNLVKRQPTVVEFDGEITKVIVRGKEYINPECGAERRWRWLKSFLKSMKRYTTPKAVKRFFTRL